jgi:hypothetical protein
MYSPRGMVLTWQGAQHGLSYGFVKMLSHEMAEERIAKFDKHEWLGQRLVVNWGVPTKSAAGNRPP